MSRSPTKTWKDFLMSGDGECVQLGLSAKTVFTCLPHGHLGMHGKVQVLSFFVIFFRFDGVSMLSKA